MNRKDLALAGSVLYKCEGTKLRRNKRYPQGNTFYYDIEFTNSDPELVKLFLNFLREIVCINENKLKCEIFGYSDLDLEEIRQFWSLATNIPLANFHKTIVLKRKSNRFKPSQWGTCKIRYSSKAAYLRLDTVITRTLGKELSLIK